MTILFASFEFVFCDAKLYTVIKKLFEGFVLLKARELGRVTVHAAYPRIAVMCKDIPNRCLAQSRAENPI